MATKLVDFLIDNVLLGVVRISLMFWSRAGRGPIVLTGAVAPDPDGSVAKTSILIGRPWDIQSLLCLAVSDELGGKAGSAARLLSFHDPATIWFPCGKAVVYLT